MQNKIITTFGTKFFSAIINLVIAVVISQNLGASGKGEQGLIITTIALILIFSNIIGGATLVYLAPRYSLQSIIAPSYLWSVINSAIFYFVMKFVNIIDEKYVIHIAILSALNSCGSVNLSILLGKGRISANNLITFIQTALIIITLMVFFNVVQKPDIHSYIISLYVAFSSSLVIGLFFLTPFFSSQSNSATVQTGSVIKVMLKLGLLNQLATIAQIMSFRISYYFIEYFHDTAKLGIYSNGVAIIESVWMVSTSITMVQYSRIVNSTDNAYSQRLTVGLMKLGLVLASVLIFILVIIPPQFYVFLFGNEFADVRNVIWFLAPGVLFFNFALVLGHYFSGTGQYGINTIAMFAGLVITITFGLLLIPQLDITGAAITASISYIFTSAIIIFIFINQARVSIFELVPKPSDIRVYRKELKEYLTSIFK